MIKTLATALFIFIASASCFGLESLKETDSIPKKRLTKTIGIDFMQYYTTLGIGLRGAYLLKNDYYLT